MGSFRYSEKEYPPSEDEGVEASQCKEKEKKTCPALKSMQVRDVADVEETKQERKKKSLWKMDPRSRTEGISSRSTAVAGE